MLLVLLLALVVDATLHTINPSLPNPTGREALLWATPTVWSPADEPGTGDDVLIRMHPSSGVKYTCSVDNAYWIEVGGTTASVNSVTIETTPLDACFTMVRVTGILRVHSLVVTGTSVLHVEGSIEATDFELGANATLQGTGSIRSVGRLTLSGIVSGGVRTMLGCALCTPEWTRQTANGLGMLTFDNTNEAVFSPGSMIVYRVFGPMSVDVVEFKGPLFLQQPQIYLLGAESVVPQVALLRFALLNPLSNWTLLPRSENTSFIANDAVCSLRYAACDCTSCPDGVDPFEACSFGTQGGLGFVWGSGTCPSSSMSCNHGIVILGSTGPFCQCFQFWSGVACDIATTCPCVNGGTCGSSSANGGPCTCVAGTSGVFCENGTPSNSAGGSGLSVGAIAGIVAGCTLALGLAIGVIVKLVHRHQVTAYSRDFKDTQFRQMQQELRTPYRAMN